MMIIAIGVSFPVGLLFGYIMRKVIAERTIASAEKQADYIILEAKKHAETTKKEMLIESKEEVHHMRIELEKETRERRNELQKIEKRYLQKEEMLERKEIHLESKERACDLKEKEVLKFEKKVNILHKEQLVELERIASLSVEEAKEQLLRNIDRELIHDKALKIKNMEIEIKQEAEKKSKDILAYTIQKCAADYVAETTVSIVELPNEEMKGRIIGREGRNINTFEQ